MKQYWFGNHCESQADGRLVLEDGTQQLLPCSYLTAKSPGTAVGFALCAKPIAIFVHLASEADIQIGQQNVCLVPTADSTDSSRITRLMEPITASASAA